MDPVATSTPAAAPVVSHAPVAAPAAAHVVETPIPVFAPAAPRDDHKMGSTGSVIAILLIVLLLVIGAFYVWGQRLSEQRAEQYQSAQQ